MKLDWLTSTYFLKPKALCLGIVLSIPAIGIANELPDFTEEDIFIDIPTVVSATRQAQKLTETPVAITVIDQELIKASGALKISELFQLVPGMQSYNPAANVPAVSYHAVSNDHPRRMEVMLNGHSVYLPLLSTVAWEILGITINDVDYIEVIRGSNVPAYGSNAFLGAINIVTKHPLNHSGTTLETTQGSFNTQKYYASTNSNIGEVEYLLSTNYEENDGNRFFDDGMVNKAVNLSGTLTPSLSDTIDFNIGMSDGFVNIGQGDNIDYIFNRRDHQTHYQHLRWNHVLNDKNEFKLSFTHNYVDLELEELTAAEALSRIERISLATAEAALLVAPFNELAGTTQFADSEHGTTHLYDIELQHTTDISPSLKTVWGLGYRYESAESEVLLSGRGKVDEEKWRLFGNAQWTPLERVTLNLGGMFEQSTIANLRFSPRAAINYAVTDSLSLRSAATRAYRTPSLLEKNGTAIIFSNTGSAFDIRSQPDPTLGPELLKSYELGLYKLWPNNGSSFDLRVFHEQITDAIDDVSSNTSDSLDNRFRSSSNTAYWRNVGAEFQLALQPTGNTNLLLSYGYNNVKGSRDRGTSGIDSLDAAGNPPTARAPLHTASLLLYTELPNDFDLSLGQYFMSEVNWLEGGYRQTFRRTDLSLSKEFQLNHNTTLETRVIVQNLLDNAYQDFYEFNEFERRTYFQLKLSY